MTELVPIQLIKLADVDVPKGRKLQRAHVKELYRAICLVEGCNWTGVWRSVWKDWETLIDECETDLLTHIEDTHKVN